MKSKAYTEKWNILRLRKGDVNSFRWCYEKYFSTVYNFCLNLTGSEVETEELVSDVFVRIWQKREILNPAYPLKSLLFKISKDLAWNHLSRKSSRWEKESRYLKTFSHPVSASGEDEFIFNECQNMLQKAIANLSPQQERIFRRRYLQGHNLAQIAEQLNISKNTVKVHLAKSKNSVLHALNVIMAIAFVISRIA